MADLTAAPATIPRGVPQLFVDDDGLAARRNAVRRWTSLAKHPANPVLLPGGNEAAPYLFGTVLREVDPVSGETLFRLWYFAGGGSKTWLAYATSRDGIAWTRPALDIVGDNTVGENAFFLPDDWRLIGFAGVVRDESAPAAERYRFMASAATADDNRKAYLLAGSPDGIRWSMVGVYVPPRPAYPDTCCFTRDPATGDLVLYTRARHAPEEMRSRGEPWYFGRAVARTTSADFRTWSEPEIVMTPTLSDDFDTEIYALFAYPYGGQWVGLHQVHRSHPTHGFIDIGVSHSRDGIRWARERDLVLTNGGIGAWDRFNQCVATAPVRVGDELWIYYSGRLYRHGEYKRAKLPDTGPGHVAVGIARLRLDGWCALAADFGGGEVVTKPVALPAGSLALNVKSDWGEVTVEALDESGNILATSHPVAADGVRVPVAWASGALPADGLPVSLRFRMKNALLYAWIVE